MKFTTTLLVTSICIIARTPSFAQQTYKLSVVPPLAGYRDAMASSINDVGDVAGYVSNPLTPQSMIGFVNRGG